MNSIKINIPKGHKIGHFDEKTGEITFVEIPQSPRERLKGWPDVLDHHNMTQTEFDKWCEGLRPHEIGAREEEMIVAAYNGRQLNDPLPDFTDGTTKGWPWFVMGSPSGAGFRFGDYGLWLTCSYVGARLVFFGPEWKQNLLDAVEKFLPHYKNSRTL